MTIIPITSSSQFNTILGSNTYVVVDFYADWCGPCKAIAPIFAQLATSNAKPGRMAFVKVDVDSQQDVARKYGISAMPTFLIIKNGKVTNTLRGADPNGLRTAVMAASADAGKAPAQASASFQSTGHVLGNKPSESRTTRPGAGAGGMSNIQASIDQYFRQVTSPGGLVSAILRFLGLYFTTLLSLDPRASAEQSSFRAQRR